MQQPKTEKQVRTFSGELLRSSSSSRTARVQIGMIQIRYLARPLERDEMNCYCGNPVKAKGLCQKHYLADYRARKNRGELIKTPLVLTERTDKTACAVEGCQDRHRAKGYCTKHYFQARRGNK